MDDWMTDIDVDAAGLSCGFQYLRCQLSARRLLADGTEWEQWQKWARCLSAAIRSWCEAS